MLDKTRRNATARRVYAAVIERPANENGYATARLLHQDGQLGIIHRFDFNVIPRTEGRAEASAPGEDLEADRPRRSNAGDPVLLNLISDRASLDVSGLYVEALRGIEKASAQAAGDHRPARGRRDRGSRSRKGRSSKDGKPGTPEERAGTGRGRRYGSRRSP